MATGSVFDRLKRKSTAVDPNTPATDPNFGSPVMPMMGNQEVNPEVYARATGQPPANPGGFTPTTGENPDTDLRTPGGPPPSDPKSTMKTDTGSRWDPELKRQMDAIGAANGRVWRDDEYDQWIGANGYIRKDDIDGTGAALKAWTGGDIADYWQWRMATHARGDYNGDNPAELGAGDANSRRALPGGGSSFLPPATPAAVDPGGSAGSGGGGGGGGSTAARSLYQQMIETLLNTPQTVDAKSLSETPETQAFNLSAQRAEERQRAQIAERAAQTGMSNSGAFETELQGIRQDRGESEAAFLGDLASQYMDRNREKLVQGIQFAMQDAQFDKAQALTEQLAQLDAAIQRERLRASTDESRADRDLRRELGLLGIGYNYDALTAQMNQDALLGLL